MSADQTATGALVDFAVALDRMTGSVAVDVGVSVAVCVGLSVALGVGKRAGVGEWVPVGVGEGVSVSVALTSICAALDGSLLPPSLFRHLQCQPSCR